MKTVFPNSEVAHVWAQRNQQEGRNSNDTFYFEGNTIYSYGSHFPIASFIDGNYDVVLWNDSTYSSTTSGHQSHVRNAISHYRILPVKYISGNKKDNLEYYLKKLLQLAGKQERARTRDYTDVISDYVDHAKTYIELFEPDYSNDQLNEILNSDDPVNWILAEHTDITQERAEAKERERQERERKAKDVRERRTKEAIKYIPDWINGDHVSYRYMTLWSETILRIDPNDPKQVETSKGAFVPLPKARALYKLVLKTVESGKPWKANGQQFRIGHYSVDKIESDGTLIAGCHKIEFSEISRFAESQGWNVTVDV